MDQAVVVGVGNIYAAESLFRAGISPLREAGKAAVHVALCKLVHKPRGAKPGLVPLSGGRNLEIRMQPDRLARLVRPDRKQ